MQNYFIDTHSHIDMIEDIELETIIKNANENGIKKIIIPSADESSFEPVLKICEKYENVFCMLGVFPQEAQKWNEKTADTILTLAKNNRKVIGIGEIGLDYYWDTSFVELQKDIFIKQIEIANELNLPFAVHDREAHKDTFDIITRYNKGSDVLLHCFSGSVEFARECIKEGFYLALGGVVTFKNAKKMKEVAMDIPLDRLMLETDAPYLTPVPHRGKTNEPKYIPLIAQEIANLRGIEVEEVAKQTTLNAEKVFKI
ncbi:TatD family hydrolase [bacterium]|nr:TatD family hydrolase [bacterium]